MYLTRITTAKKHGFKAKVLHRKKDLPFHTLKYFKQKSSFFVAVLSLTAFLAGNMVGTHGWYAFWQSMWAKYDDSLIAYTGTVPPIAFVPDYRKWSAYGGNAEAHTYRTVPQDLLIPLPAYNSASLSTEAGMEQDLYYSVADQGSYSTGVEKAGSHPGVDIRVPEGTPIRSIANGIVETVRDDRSGYGKLIVIRHPNAPDPSNPSKATVLHSVYAHLSAQLVVEGEVVQKGQQIALSGRTGDVTGAHLHFQIDRDEAPWHPYWPFTGAEASAAGLTFTQAVNKGFHQDRLQEFTINPMVYVQSSMAAPVIVQGNGLLANATSSAAKVKLTPAQLRQQRIDQRMARQNATQKATVATAPVQTPAVVLATPATSASASSSSSSQSVTTITSPSSESSASSASSESFTTVTSNAISTVTIEVDGAFTERNWEIIRVILRDSQGNPVSSENLTKNIYLQAAFGDAEFEPKVLKPSDFHNGAAKVNVLPRGRRTLVIAVQPMNVVSAPLKNEGN